MESRSWAAVAGAGSRSASNVPTASEAQISPVAPMSAGDTTKKQDADHSRATKTQDHADNSNASTIDFMRRHHQHREQHQPLIVSLRFDDRTFELLTHVRKQYFPHNNNLDAHLTILHNLPFSELHSSASFLENLCRKTSPFHVSFGKLIHRSKIILLPVESRRLNDVAYAIQDRFWQELSDQDRQNFKGHITLCNKRSVEETSKLGPLVSDAVKHIASCQAVGIDIWGYRGQNPWQHEKFFAFG